MPAAARNPRLLFIKLKHIGDSLLLTPTLAAARTAHPEASIWVVVRAGCEGILAGCPAIDRVLTAAEPEMARRSRGRGWRDVRLALELRRERFDYAFELTDGDRGRWLACVSGARWRCANDTISTFRPWWRLGFNRISSCRWFGCHRAERDFRIVQDILPLTPAIPPLVFVRERTSAPELGLAAGPFGVLHPGTRWRRKRWPMDKWVALGQFLLDRMAGLAVSAGPDEEEKESARVLCGALGERARSTDGRCSWNELAGLLYQARLFVGVDTAAMHLAAACQCPTVAIFGPSEAAEWAPWQVPHRLVQAPLALRRSLPEDEQTQAVEVAAVMQACRELLESEALERSGARSSGGP